MALSEPLGESSESTVPVTEPPDPNLLSRSVTVAADANEGPHSDTDLAREPRSRKDPGASPRRRWTAQSSRLECDYGQ